MIWDLIDALARLAGRLLLVLLGALVFGFGVWLLLNAAIDSIRTL